MGTARHGCELVAELRAAARRSGRPGLLGAAIVVAIAVLREGSEVVLPFLRGCCAAGSSWSLVAGGLVGLVLGSSVCLLTYLGLVTIPSRYLFGVTSGLIALLAAGMAAQAIAFLEQANILTALDETVWDTSWILSDSSFLGKALHTDQPTAMQVSRLCATLAVIIVLMKPFSSPPSSQQHPRTADPVIPDCRPEPCGSGKSAIHTPALGL